MKITIKLFLSVMLGFILCLAIQQSTNNLYNDIPEAKRVGEMVGGIEELYNKIVSMNRSSSSYLQLRSIIDRINPDELKIIHVSNTTNFIDSTLLGNKRLEFVLFKTEELYFKVEIIVFNNGTYKVKDISMVIA